MDFPAFVHGLQQVVITPRSALSPCAAAGGTANSVTYPAANRAIFVPFRLTEPLLVVKLFVLNGTVASGNIDLGIYDAHGTRLVSAGTTAQAGTSTVQEFDITDTLLGPGLFYLAVAKDDTTGTILRLSSPAQQCRVLGMAQMASAFVLPATATFAAVAAAVMPMIGLSGRTAL